MDNSEPITIYRERIGQKEFEIQERDLDAFDDLVLWPDNPRLQQETGVANPGQLDEASLELALQKTRGYDTLYKSIKDLGQMEPVYVWKGPNADKFLVLEGATRVTIIRDLARKITDTNRKKPPMVKAKVLPQTFTPQERAILLAKIHVRGSGVRSWGRYIEAKFIYETINDDRLMSASDLAQHMGKSLSWVTRLRDAYQFATRFVDHVDNDDATRMVIERFSTLEEISKATEIGPKVRDYENPRFDKLRDEVFEMVRNEVFKEYRDARFMKDFHDDPEKWAQLKSGEKHVAHRLASEIKSNSSSLKGKIQGLETQIQRELKRSPDAINEDDIDSLRAALDIAETTLHAGVTPLRRKIRELIRLVEDASLSEIRDVEDSETQQLLTSIEYLTERRERYANNGVAS